jgi:S-adenosylmethionine synthetase
MSKETNYVFTSESVSEGHPDKVADQISDGVIDALLTQDRYARVACETLVKNNIVVLAGEITSDAPVNYKQIVRDVINEIGYNDPSTGFDAEHCEIMEIISRQSPDISMGVTADRAKNKLQGAGDQGHMFGFACDETSELMPLPISLAHSLVLELSKQRKSGAVDFLRPDAKSQVTVAYDKNDQPTAVTAVLISTQHTADVSLDKIKEYVTESVIKKTIPAHLQAPNMRILVNPTGNFVIGGPVGDCGLTGRKIIVDTYGGYSRHGGGAFSGKDPSKVDRSAAYAARYLAKNVVAAGLAKKCEIQISYAIGVAEPTSLYVSTFGTGTIPDSKIAEILGRSMDLTPAGIIDTLNLLNPIYRTTAAYGHFGRTPGANGEFSWEKTDLVERLKKSA